MLSFPSFFVPSKQTPVREETLTHPGWSWNDERGRARPPNRFKRINFQKIEIVTAQQIIFTLGNGAIRKLSLPEVAPSPPSQQ